jgi:MFS family permease
MCGHGERAMGAASLLTGQWLTQVSVLDGGPQEWAEANGQPLETGPMKPAEKAVATPVRGLRANAAQFTLLVAVNALVGGMLGQECTVLPLLATDVFGLDSYTAALTYILAFGLAKAPTNYLAGTWSDRYGRKPVLVAGWLVAVPVPLLLILAPDWWISVAANVLLGISQGLTWSTTVIMKIDLVGPKGRGLAMGLNESAGHLALAVTALLTGAIAANSGLRPEPFLVGIAYAALGLGLSTLAGHETRGHADHEATTQAQTTDQRSNLTDRQIFTQTSFREPALSSASQAGLVNNLNDGLAWGLFPCCSSPPDSPSARPGSWSRCIPPSGVLGSSPVAPCRTDGGAST